MSNDCECYSKNKQQFDRNDGWQPNKANYQLSDPSVRVYRGNNNNNNNAVNNAVNRNVGGCCGGGYGNSRHDNGDIGYYNGNYNGSYANNTYNWNDRRIGCCGRNTWNTRAGSCCSRPYSPYNKYISDGSYSRTSEYFGSRGRQPLFGRVNAGGFDQPNYWNDDGDQ